MGLRGAALIGSVAILFAAVSLAAQERPEIIPFAGGQYMIYGGGLGDHESPSAGNSKLFLSLEGEVARETYDNLGADSLADICYQSGNVVRQREDVMCAHTGDEYYCYVGFDLTTGKSIPSWIC